MNSVPSQNLNFYKESSVRQRITVDAKIYGTLGDIDNLENLLKSKNIVYFQIAIKQKSWENTINFMQNFEIWKKHRTYRNIQNLEHKKRDRIVEMKWI